MAVDDNDLYNDDLYGDLEDLDATQLDEELIDPDELQPPPQASSAPATSANNAQSQQQYQPPAGHQGAGQSQGFAQQTPQQSFNQGQQQQLPQDADGLDRIRPSDMPDEGKMFIGGLNWETTDDGLRNYMAQFGEIDACTIMRDPNGRSRGFAFLTYSSAVSVAKVLSQVHHLDGKQIDPKRAIPRAEHERTAKVFVGGLAPSVTSESLKEFLTQFGGVMDATVMFDRETTRSKGFAFATFADEDSVGRAMAASGIELDGKPIEIKKAQPRGAGNQPKQFGGQVRPGFQQSGFGAPAAGGMGGGFDPNAMAMMYQNMMKGSGMGGMGMGGGFDPNAMAMMYQNMMKTGMGGMGNAPAINPNMANNMMRNNMGGMGMGGMGGMGMGGMGGMGGMAGMGGMGMMGMGGMGNMGGMGMGGAGGFNNQMAARPMGNSATARPVPNAPRGPAAMRTPQAGGVTPSQSSGGAGAQRYSTQGTQRARPY